MEDMKEKLEKKLLKHLQPGHGRSYSVSVEIDGKPLFKHHSGTTVIDNIPYSADTNTVFDVGSLAKQFVACCIAILVCEKRLNLDDSVRIYLPKMKEYADKITIRHLLSMTAGCREIYCLKHMQSSSQLDEMELFYRQEQPANDVGKFTGYSNTCYTLLGHIVERVTGGIEQFAKQRIFDPLGMVNTQSYGIMGDGGLRTTAEDLVLWHNCLINRNLPGSPSGLFDLLFSTYTLNNGELCPYGFGFFYDENNRNIIWQHGDMGKWQCVMRVNLKKKLSIIVLTHFSETEPIQLALDLENAIINELFNLPEQGNYISAYYNRPKHTSITKNAEHPEFPNARVQNAFAANNWDKYYGRYYSYEMDTYFDVIPDVSRFQMKYADKDDIGYINLLDFSNENNLIAHTCGDWGSDWLHIEFYGDEDKIDFFVLQEGIGHFYFIKCAL